MRKIIVTTFVSRGALLFGPLAGVILIAGIAAIAQLVPGYSSVHQTVSEIGEMGSPMRIPFAIMLFSVAASMLVFALGLRRVSLDAGRSPIAAYLTGFFAVPSVGAAVCAFPHPLHNFFGESELVCYLAPLALAITWRRAPEGRAVVRFSWIMTVLLWLAIAANLSIFDRGGALFALERPFYGLVQRSIFAAFCAWCIGVGLLLFSRSQNVMAELGGTGAPQGMAR
jgi:hypothetical membrane protein